MGTAKRDRQKQYRQQRLAAARAAQQRRKRRRSVVVVAIGLVLLFIAVFVFSQQIDDDGDVATTSTTTSSVPTGEFAYGTGPCPAADGTSAQTLTFPDAPDQCIDPANTYTATFTTSEGAITFALDTETTPGTTNNFVALSRYHFYDGTQLFRTNTGIGIIQGGAPTNNPGDPGPGYDLPDEGFDYASLPQGPGGAEGGPYSYVAGDLVMARSGQPNGAGAQFFFCATDACSNLDSGGVYVKFGHVNEGLDILQAILGLHQDTDPAQPGEGAPSRPVTVSTVTIEETPAAG